MIVLRDVCKTYQVGDEIVRALDHASLTVRDGEFVSIIGPSGSGKSTMMNIIGCLDTADSGEYLLDDIPIEDYTENELAQIRSRKIGFVFQSFNLIPQLTAQENVELPLIYQRVRRSERRRRVAEALERVQLTGRRHHLPSELSGGQQQRVAIARAIAAHPLPHGPGYHGHLSRASRERQHHRAHHPRRRRSPPGPAEHPHPGRPGEGGGPMIQSVRMAIKSISGNKMRAFLTMLGIIIGVMALVILVSLVSGATGNVTDTIASLGSDQITVRISDDKGRPVYITDLNEWMGEGAFGRIAPVATESVTAKYGTETGSLTVYGTTAPYLDIQKLDVLVGRFLKTADEENVSFVCVINETAATELVGYADCVGEDIRLNGQRFRVVGVLKDDDNSLTSAFRSGSLVAYVPYGALVRISDSATPKITSFYVSAAETGTVDEAKERMTEILKERFDQDEDAFTLSSQNALESAMNSITSILAVLLGGIAAISLIVGGIGIMNIMLVTVTERTREIGIRKAIGASRSMILTQFLVEAVVICMLGCALGILGSWGVLRLITTVVSGLDISFQMSGGVVLIAVLFCFFIGIVFGLYPANKAARMAPIDALHYGG